MSLHPDKVEQINRIYISFSTNKTDQSFWNQTSIGNFITKSAYLLQLQITNQLQQPNTVNNSWLWHFKCLNKLKFFLWLLVHHKFPTRDFLYTKKILQSNFCQFCPNTVEDINHISLNANTPAHLWPLFNLCIHQAHNLANSLKDKCNKDTTTHTPNASFKTPYSTLLLWNIWINRNLNLFNHNSATIYHKKIILQVAEFVSLTLITTTSKPRL